MNRNFRVLIGVLWILIFVALIGLLSFKFNLNASNSVKTFIATSENKIKALVTGKDHLSLGSGSLNSSVSQEVVQEESRTIDVVNKVSPAVVSVVVRTISFSRFSGPSSTSQGIGTGFIVEPNGIIVTNSHVVDDPSGQYAVVLKDGTTYDVKSIQQDVTSDLAILKIDATNLPTVVLGDSDSIKVGQTAIAIGNALGRFDNTVTKGVISGIARELQASSPTGAVKTYENAIQTDASLNPGNSGGPLLNSAGQVIGINVATASAENINFAIPINNLKPILDSFLATGKIVKPFLGVSYTMVSKEIAALRRLPEGAFVSMVIPNSPANEAGLVSGDIIKRIDGVALSETKTLAMVVSKYKVGDKITLVIDHNGTEMSLSAVLGETPQNAQP